MNGWLCTSIISSIVVTSIVSSTVIASIVSSIISPVISSSFSWSTTRFRSTFSFETISRRTSFSASWSKRRLWKFKEFSILDQQQQNHYAWTWKLEQIYKSFMCCILYRDSFFILSAIVDYNVKVQSCILITFYLDFYYDSFCNALLLLRLCSSN